MKIDEAYQAIIFRGLAARRRSWAGDFGFIFKNQDEKNPSRVRGVNWRDLIDARREVFYPTPADIIADDWDVITMTMNSVNERE